VIRLLIAAASPVVRAGLEALAASSPDLQVVGSFPDISVVEDLADLHPEVILSAIEPDEILPTHEDGTPALVLLTNEVQPAWTAEALRRGVRAILPRDASQAEILAAITAAASDLAVVHPREMELLLSSALAPQAQHEAAGFELTPRELEVLRMIADGAPNKIIAWKLGISEHTVKFHVASILAKVGASSRTEAVTIGIRKGLVLL
jgi:two-component system, NarL family, response regulator YdfI